MPVELSKPLPWVAQASTALAPLCWVLRHHTPITQCNGAENGLFMHAHTFRCCCSSVMEDCSLIILSCFLSPSRSLFGCPFGVHQLNFNPGTR